MLILDCRMNRVLTPSQNTRQRHKGKQLFLLSLQILVSFNFFFFFFFWCQRSLGEHSTTGPLDQPPGPQIFVLFFFRYLIIMISVVLQLGSYLFTTIPTTYFTELTRENPDHSYFSLQCLTIVV